MAFITNENGEFYVPDELASDPTKSVADLLQVAIPRYEYENMKMNEAIWGKLQILSWSIRASFEELCNIAGEDPTGVVSSKFFQTYEPIFKPLYEWWLIPEDLYIINRENLEIAYQD